MNVIKTTLITTIIVCLTFGAIVLFKEHSVRQFFYLTIMVSGSVIIPIFLGTLMYEYIKRKVSDKGLMYFVFKVILFGTAVQVALIIWSTLDVIYFYGNFSGLNIDNIIKDYKKEFLPSTHIVILISILIPTIDKELTRRANKKNG